LAIDLVFKIAAIGILVAVLNQLLVRAGREDIATLTTIAGLVIVLLMVVDLVSNLFDSVKRIFGLY
jgi:stage III sporulation protein AC